MTLQRIIGPRNKMRLWYHWSRAFLAALLYGFSARKLYVIGITGSDGKTTTVEMVAHILRKNGINCGALSTACFRIGDEVTWNATQKTSPSPFLIQRFLRKLVRSGCTHAVLEYSSHGLVQHRTDFTWPKVAGITNLTPEHLDYHGTMQQYAEDKAKLFRMLRGKGAKVLNVDDQTFDAYKLIPSERTCTYSASNNHESSDEHVWVTDVTSSQEGSTALLHCHAEERSVSKRDNESSAFETVAMLPPQADNIHFSLPIAGVYNLENALCAIGCVKGAGIDFLASARALSDFQGAPGRFEKIEHRLPFTVLVDFTVTPNAYRKTLMAARGLTAANGRLLVLCGSCGERMKEKRPEIGRICAELADIVVVTNEDPYGEDPEKIIDEVWSGIPAQAPAQTHRITDRREGITFLLKQARPGDVVLLCGKGADTTMWTRSGKVPWDERKIVRDVLSTVMVSPVEP